MPKVRKTPNLDLVQIDFIILATSYKRTNIATRFPKGDAPRTIVEITNSIETSNLKLLFAGKHGTNPKHRQIVTKEPCYIVTSLANAELAIAAYSRRFGIEERRALVGSPHIND